MRGFQFVAITIATIACIVSCEGRGEVTTNGVIFTTIKSDGTPNTWTQEDLVKALGLLNRKYHRDCENAGGRKAWHGKLTKEIVDEDAETKTEVYEDGTTFVYKFRKVTPTQSVKDYNSRLPTVKTNGVPASLARARMARSQERQTTNTVIQVLIAGESKEGER